MQASLDSCELTWRKRYSAPHSGCLCICPSHLKPWSHSKSTAGSVRWQKPAGPAEREKRVCEIVENYLSQNSALCKHLCVYQTVDEEELQDVQQHPPKRDLQRPQMRVGREQRNEAQGTENVCDGKHRLSY